MYGDRRVGTFDLELIKKPGSQNGDQAGNRNLLPPSLVNQAWLYFARLNVNLTTQIMSDTFRRRPNLSEAHNERNYRHKKVISLDLVWAAVSTGPHIWVL